MDPATVGAVSASVLVACLFSALAAGACAVLAWSNARPATLRRLLQKMEALQGDRTEWLQRMESFADAAAHDLDQAKEQRRAVQNKANRQVREERRNGPEIHGAVFGPGDEGIDAARAYWAQR